MDANLTRRRFLEGSAALIGVALVGCTPQQAAQLKSFANSDGSFTLTGLGELSPGSALPFNFPNGDPGLVYLTSSGQSGALAAKCTHAGCTVEWNAGNEKVPLRCPCHESEFTLDGKVLSGPAKAPLLHYSLSRHNGNATLKPNG